MSLRHDPKADSKLQASIAAYTTNRPLAGDHADLQMFTQMLVRIGTCRGCGIPQLLSF